jgi:hypothetical protein
MDAVHRAGGGFSKQEAFALEHGFKGRARLRQEVLDGKTLDVLQFQIKGIIVGEHQQWRGCLRVGGVDLTEDRNDPYPILCAIGELQRPGTCMFEFCSDAQPFTDVNYVEEWMTLCQVPVDALQFAKRGRRQLMFSFGVAGQSHNQLPRNHDEVVLEYDNDQAGFVEMAAVQAEVDRMTVQLAFLVSAADLQLDPAEGEVVQNWIDKRLSGENAEARRQTRRDELNKALLEASALRQDTAGNIATLSRAIARKGVQTHRLDALELCLEVVGADGTATPAELGMIEQIAANLRVDAARLEEMVHNALPVGKSA